ncbi:MAG: nuclear transport factor 2 family protein [Blastocatellia bacterium]|nr:nuclear transport factor 2 family protein [Blastocatellia bacterium]
MPMTNQEALARWLDCVASHDMSKLDAITAETAVFRSPFLWKPKPGREMMKIVLSAADKVFEDFAYHRQMTDGTSWTLEFSAHIGEISLKGIDLIRFDADGLIEEFEVMIRPAKGLQALAEAMVKQMTLQGTYDKFSQA